jgi:type VI secretion system protein ImpK
VTSARYALCACLDEAVLSTPWGAQSEWAQQTLLVALHREAWGGEKFFDMLEGISQDPERHIDLMELQYMCLALGFSGKYQVSSHGQARLADVRQDLYRRIRNVRGAFDPALSLKWKGVDDRRNPVIRYVPWWVVGAAALAVITVTFTVNLARLNRAAAPTQAALSRVGLDSFSRTQPAAALAGPTLRQLLSEEEQRQTLTVEEDGALTRITLVAPNLFASGSAAVNAQYEDTLRRVAAAIQRVPGRVLVVGHTDDQAIRSLRYRDNFELSRERAVSVADILKQSMGESAGIEWNGVGSSQPRFEPASDPGNRARNRRVEIVHVRES